MMLNQHRFRRQVLGMFLCSCLFLLPQYVDAVVISEIAWMGTVADANDEWIELHNRGDAVDVTGWTLRDGDAITITLSGTIGSGAFALLERSDDSSVPSVVAFQTYVGALSNAGETLTLRTADGTVIDQVMGGDGWTHVGGNNTTKETPQRGVTDTWVTAAPTPGQENISSPGSSGGGSSGTSTVTRSSSHRNIQPASRPAISRTAETLSLSIQAPQVVYVGQPVTFTAESQGSVPTVRKSLIHHWNFGDTFTEKGESVTHAFAYAGEYVVVAESRYKEQAVYARHDIAVIPLTLTLARGTQGEIVLRNASAHEMDIGGFTIQGEKTFVFPKLTILKAGGVLSVPPARIGTNAGVVTVHDPAHTAVATLGMLPVVRRSVAHAATTVPVALATTSDTVVAHPDIPQGVIRIGDTDAAPTPTTFGRLLSRLVSILGL
jgi:hypothetical protein